MDRWVDGQMGESSRSSTQYVHYKSLSLVSASALRNWVKQSQIDQAATPNGALTTEERQELNRLRREVKRLQME